MFSYLVTLIIHLVITTHKVDNIALNFRQFLNVAPCMGVPDNCTILYWGQISVSYVVSLTECIQEPGVLLTSLKVLQDLVNVMCSVYDS